MAAFYGGPVVDEEALQVLERSEIDYVLLWAGSPLNTQLGHLPGFGVTDAPSERYRVYRVDREELRDIPEALLSGNTYLTQKLQDQAIYYRQLEALSADGTITFN